MTELKTLKDFEKISEKIWDSKARYNLKGFVAIDELKAEAVKWINREIELLSDNNKEAESVLFKWMDFFNITEEEVK